MLVECESRREMIWDGESAAMWMSRLLRVCLLCFLRSGICWRGGGFCVAYGDEDVVEPEGGGSFAFLDEAPR